MHFCCSIRYSARYSSCGSSDLEREFARLHTKMLMMLMMTIEGYSYDEYDDNKVGWSIPNNQRRMAWSLGQLVGSALDGESILNGSLIWPCYQVYSPTHHRFGSS